MFKLIDRIAGRISSWYLNKHDITWIQPDCGCFMYPHTPLTTNCPELN